MNEFKSLLMEAFVGEEPFDPEPGRAVLEAAVQRFERQERVLRIMIWFSVVFMSVLAYWAAWTFFKSDPELGTKGLVLRATIFLFATQAVGWAKMFLFSTQKHMSILKELKRVQIALLDEE